MMVKEAFAVLVQTLKDTWEELYSLVIANISWFFVVLGVPLLLMSIGHPAAFIGSIILFIVLFSISAPGIYTVGMLVARGKTFHFSDMLQGIKLHWWRGLLWAGANGLVFLIIRADIMFFITDNPALPAWLNGPGGIVITLIFLYVMVFWLAMQVYFWPMLLQQQEPKLVMAWRNCALLLLAQPIFAILVILFGIVLLAVSVGLIIPLVFVGAGVQAILGSAAVLNLLVKFGKIEEIRPKPLR